jgi:hypothetical protein
MNKMYIHKSVTRHQHHGIIVSLPKDKGDITPTGYRPITLMNTDYKLLTRIMARRLTPVLEEQLTSSQYYSVPGKSILEAVSVLRDVVAQAELTRTPRSILSLDFRSAFDCSSHHYLVQILAGYGISEWFIDLFALCMRTRRLLYKTMASWPALSLFRVPFDRDARLACPCMHSAYIPSCALWRTD